MAQVRVDAMWETGDVDGKAEWVASVDCRLRANRRVHLWTWREDTREYRPLDTGLVGIITPGVFG